jgi:hypothetical protein
MLKIVSLIAFLFCQLVAEACPSLSRSSAASGGDARDLAAALSVPSSVEAARAVSASSPSGIAAPAPAPAPPEAACVSMTVIRTHPRRNRHEELRLRGRKEIS